MIGQHLGDPFEQDVKGTLLFDVKDKGYNVTEGARFSGTRTETPSTPTMPLGVRFQILLECFATTGLNKVDILS